MGIIFEDYYDPIVIIHFPNTEGYTLDLDL